MSRRVERRVKVNVNVKLRPTLVLSLQQCWALCRTYRPTKGPLSSNNSLNSVNHSNPRMASRMSHPLPSTVKTSISQTCSTFFNQNGASTNATAMNGRLNALRCECVAPHDLVLPFHSLMFFQARIALLEGERRSFENIKVDLMRRIKMLEYALRVERSVPILSPTVPRGLTRFRAVQSNSHNPALSHPSQFHPQKLPLCSLLPRRTKHLAIRRGAVLAPLVAKVSRLLFIPLLLLTRVKILPYLQRGDKMVPPPPIQREQGRHRYLGGRVRMAQPRLQALANHHLAVTLRAALAAGTTSNSTLLIWKSSSILTCFPDACKKYNISLPPRR